MKRINGLICILTFALVVMTLPAFAQRGAGVGLGGQARVGAGSTAGAGAQAGGGSAGARTNTDVHARTSEEASERRTGAANQSRPNADAHTSAAIVTRIDKNPALEAKVQSLLPKGMSISTAAAGFRNEGQFLAAVNAS